MILRDLCLEWLGCLEHVNLCLPNLGCTIWGRVLYSGVEMEFVWKNIILAHVGCPTQISPRRSVLEKNGYATIYFPNTWREHILSAILKDLCLEWLGCLVDLDLWLPNLRCIVWNVKCELFYYKHYKIWLKINKFTLVNIEYFYQWDNNTRTRIYYIF